ncbi:hypothetical protein BDW72DRAFT_197266, partial [Aspergillus terricola var. indicus]
MDEKVASEPSAPPYEVVAEKEKVPATKALHADPARRGSTALNIIQNPLQNVSREQAVFEARAFAQANGMGEHADVIGRAALVARDPDNFESIPELTQDERAALAYERDHKWHGPRMLWYSIGLCAIGAATQGWDQTGSNGANLQFHDEFNIAGKGRDEWI